MVANFLQWFLSKAHWAPRCEDLVDFLWACWGFITSPPPLELLLRPDLILVAENNFP